jgi:hypothetical protein
MCRQINGCANNVSEFLMGTKGYTDAQGSIWAPDGSVVYATRNESGEVLPELQKNPYDQEHVDLVTCIRQDVPINEAEDTAISTLTGIMGRISAYTGKEISWDEMMNSDLWLGPKTYIMGDTGIQADVPVPGTESQS